MTKTGKSPLVNLSSETKALINQGVYSLYSLASGSAPAGAKYVLYTSKRSFLLNETGAIVREDTPDLKIPVDHAVNYVDNDGTAHSTLKKFA